MSLAARNSDVEAIRYPDSDGQPMADNTEHFAFIQLVQGNLDMLLPDFVAGDHLWYPVEGHPEIRMAPDVYVALGRPKGRRGSYQQWPEGGVAPQVVFEWWSSNATIASVVAQHRFYQRYGVEEFYTWDQVHGVFAAFIRGPAGLDPVSVAGGWVSPRLGVRFREIDGELRMFLPNGEPFRTHAELAAQRDDEALARQAAEQARQAAEQARDAAEARALALAEKLRSLGIEL